MGHPYSFQSLEQFSYCIKETAWRERGRGQKSSPAASENKQKKTKQDLLGVENLSCNAFLPYGIL